MSDRLAVMSKGRIQQVGTPAEVYEDPATAYVADFLGVSNLMAAQAAGDGNVRLGDFSFTAGRGERGARGPVRIVVRPERVGLEAQGAAGENRIPGMVERVLYVGSVIQVLVHLAHGETLQAFMQNRGGELPWQQGTAVTVHLPADAIRVLVDETEVEGEEAPATSVAG